jgi:hypothetical protein
VTAAIVFVIGQQLFPVRPRQAPPAPTTIPAASPPASAPPGSTLAVDGATQQAVASPEAGAPANNVAEAGAPAADAAHAATQPKEETPETKKATAEAAPKPGAEEAPAGASAGDRKPSDKQDKDLARESWRHNRPDISVSGSKTSIMIPIRGSIRGSDFKILDKRRKVIVTLPKAVSMITLRVYNLKHPLFKKVWIDQDEANAQPNDGTKLRFILGQTLDPQVEITDDFVRVTVRRPEPAGDHAEKRGESSSEEDVPAPAAEKPSE